MPATRAASAAKRRPGEGARGKGVSTGAIVVCAVGGSATSLVLERGCNDEKQAASKVNGGLIGPVHGWQHLYVEPYDDDDDQAERDAGECNKPADEINDEEVGG